MRTLRAVVVGVGRMGRHHARVYADMPDVDLVAIVDPDPVACLEVAREYACVDYDNPVDLCSETDFDLASICTPTVHHHGAAITMILMGAHVLVEKPVAATVPEARDLIASAHQRGVVLAVGHIERCNPIVTEVKRRMDAGDLGDVYRVATRRVGPSPRRIRDVGVAVDLATHDLDVMRYLLDCEPLDCHAMLQHRRHGWMEDGVDALLRFESGAVGVLSCDWLSTAKQRTLAVTGAQGEIVADYIAQEATVYTAPDSCESVTVPREEPLVVELRSFVAACRGESRPAATGEDGLRALEMAIELGEEEGNG